MFRIGAFSKLVHVSARMLRHYEKCGLIYPAHFDKASGHRYYSISQISLIDRIVKLRDMGFSIEEIGDALENYDDSGFLETMLAEKQSVIESEMEQSRQKLENIRQMNSVMATTDYRQPQKIQCKPLPAQKVLSLREILPSYAEQEALWNKLLAYLQANNLHDNLAGQLLLINHNDEYAEKDVDLEVCALVKELGESKDGFVYKETEPVPLAAVSTFVGYYSEMALWESIMAQWIDQNGYESIGKERSLCLKHSLNCDNPNAYETEMQFPVQKQKTER